MNDIDVESVSVSPYRAVVLVIYFTHLYGMPKAQFIFAPDN